jgi:lysophospholipase L1-like esterase
VGSAKTAPPGTSASEGKRHNMKHRCSGMTAGQRLADENRERFHCKSISTSSVHCLTTMSFASKRDMLRLGVAVALVLCHADAQAGPVQAINLLPIGDSITAQGLYFNPLITTLTTNGYSPTLIANEGHGGYTIDMLRGGVAAYMNHPNVNATNTFVLLMVGVNDVSYYLMGQEDISTAPSRLGGLIGDIRTTAPLAHVIVAQISPDTAAGFDAVIRQFNRDIVPVIGSFGSSVSMVDMYAPFQPNPQPYLIDTVHPNQSGGNLMAGVWYQGIASVETPEPGSLALLTIAVTCASAYVWKKRR